MQTCVRDFAGDGARFQRFIRIRSVFHAELASRELERLRLENALALRDLYAEVGGQSSSERLSALSRLLDERTLTLAETRSAVHALEALQGDQRASAVRALSQLAGRR